MEGMLAGGGAAAAAGAGRPPCAKAIPFAGGLPGGVVDAAAERDKKSDKTFEVGTEVIMVDILVGALSLSRNDASRLCGNVWPLSQMSTSFLIFSYR